MGNKDSKSDNPRKETLRNNIVFKNLARNKPELSRKDVEERWHSQVGKELGDIVLNFLFLSGRPVRFETYDEFATAVTCGSYNEKAELLLEILSSITNEFPLQCFLSSLITSVTAIERRSKTAQIKNWSNDTTENFDAFVSYLINLAGGRKEKHTSNEISTLLPVIDRFLTCAFNELLEYEPSPSQLFPRWRRLIGDHEKTFKQCSFLRLEEVMMLNLELPVDWQLEWRLLFSTKIHGESFSRLAGQICNQGPTLLVVEDSDGFAFGGFAPASWSFNPNFAGDSSSFMFTLRPEMNIYSASNFNENFQYINQGQQTLPNGLAMGGKLEYFGLWLSYEFGHGLSNDSCTTFRNFKRLSKEKEFKIAEVEVWGVGPPPPTAAELGERSVLDGNAEIKAMLEMAGKKTYSDGLREEPENV